MKKLTSNESSRIQYVRSFADAFAVIDPFARSLRINPDGPLAITFNTQMNKTALQLCLLALLAISALSDNITASKASRPSEPTLCDKNLYKDLSKLKGRINGPGVQFDLLRTLNRTDDPKKVLQRLSHYDFSAIKNYLGLIDRSYGYEQDYLKLSSAGKASLDYENICQDLCPTYTAYNGFRTPKNLASPKPANLNNFTCSVPDNPFCNDGLDFAEAKDDNLMQETQDWYDRQGYGETALTYTMNNGEIEYCYTTKRLNVVILCEKFQQYRLAVSGYIDSPAFREEAYETVLTGDLSSQTAMNYILTKMKFGERIGAIYNDCRRYGKMPTDIMKPIL